MAVSVVFETHSITVDNERGLATGWLPGELSERGRGLSRELGRRRADDGLAAVLCSDLARAEQTARIAFRGTSVPVLLDWRLRECDYAVARIGWFLADLPRRRDGQRVLLIGHVATRWGLDHWLNGVPLEDLADGDFAWQEGWEYQLD
jgi:2,3-bisphosphoglycerate-dependent phosphoglycerate mutase